MSVIAQGELGRLALCWRLERPDGGGIGLTSHDQPITSEDVFFSPAPGMMPSSVTRQLGLEPHSGEVSGALSADAIDEADLALGRWDGARVRLTAVDWQDGEAAPVQLIAGELGTVSTSGDGFSAELRGAAAKLNRAVCPVTSAECRAELGDKQCRVDLAGRTVSAAVTNVGGSELTIDQALDGRFVLGRLRYMSGANCGLSTIILGVEANVIQVRDLPRAVLENGTKVELREGCDKRFQTCAERFANAVNFRGEPHLPGNDLLTRYPGI